MSRPSSLIANLAWFAAFSGGLIIGASVPAVAHTRMDMPPARDMMDGYKPTRTPGFVLPCGVARKAAQPVTTFPAGSTIGMKWTETIYHPGCFIVDFAQNDTGPSTVFQRLQIVPHNPGTLSSTYQVQMKLPSTPCTNCILRVRQYMMDANPCPPANLKDTDDNLYYSCGNVVLSSGGAVPDAGAVDAGKDAAADAPVSSGTGGMVTATGGTTGSGSGGAADNGSGGATGSGSGGISGSGGAVTASGSGGASGVGGSGSNLTSESNGCSVGGSAPAFGSSLVLFALAFVLAVSRRRARLR